MPTDPRGLRGDAPLLDAWLRFQEQAPAPFTIPGHKHRTDLVGDVVVGDIPLYGGLDTVKLARGVLADAEARAAVLWDADVCRFSVGGSTHANQALALAIGSEGDRVLVGRTLHRSVLLGLVLAGLEPGRIDEPDVAGSDRRLGLAAVARQARLIVHQRELPSRQPIEHGGLADIRPSNDGDGEGHRKATLRTLAGPGRPAGGIS